MLSKIWAAIMIISIAYSFVSGRVSELSDAIFKSAASSVDFMLTTGAVMVFWQAMLSVAAKSGLSQRLARILAPVISFLFRGVKKRSVASELIAQNISANMLGLSNAATPLGMEAMKELSKKSKQGVATDDMCLLAVINSASVQLIPSTLIAIRSSFGSADAASITVPIWISSFCTLVFAVSLCKIFSKYRGQFR